MKIIVLSENNVSNQHTELGCEHGLCLYVEACNHTFLFDTGCSALFAENAQKLGVDLSKVDFVVLSHGHYDHGGGIEKFFKINNHAKVYANKYAFEPHWHDKEKYIGLEQKLLDYKERFVFTDSYFKIDDGLELFNTNDRSPKYPIVPYGLHTQTNGIFTDEDFRHEQYLKITDGKSILLSGCSHKGILNIEDWFNPDILIGGFHFMQLDCTNADDQKILKQQAKELLNYKTVFYTCHCTTKENYDYLKPLMDSKLNYAATGDVFEI